MAEALGSSQRVTRLMRENLPRPQTPVPRTRFNRPVTAHRAIGFERFSLDEVRAMKNEVPGATVNDVALTICGGALRRYLDAKGELPGQPLMAMAPINTRKDRRDYKMGNQVSAMFVPIGTHLEDPLERLQVVRDATHSAKQMTNAVGAELMTRYGEFVPAALSNLAQRLTAEYARANRMAPAFNCSITNVPGPQVPLYMMGCRLITTLGYGPVVHNMGLIIPISSYCGEFTVSFTSCREMIPDPDFFMACLRESFDATRRATLGDQAEEKLAAVARNYSRMAEEAQVRVTRDRAARAT
jgi:WS/DGAT/MGAT family acyltransferase